MRVENTNQGEILMPCCHCLCLHFRFLFLDALFLNFDSSQNILNIVDFGHFKHVRCSSFRQGNRSYGHPHGRASESKARDRER